MTSLTDISVVCSHCGYEANLENLNEGLLIGGVWTCGYCCDEDINVKLSSRACDRCEVCVVGCGRIL